VADATIVGRCADATLFIIRAEMLDRSLLPDVQQYYDDNRLPKMSIILNGTTDSFSYYGYHRYGSRYGYYGGEKSGEYLWEWKGGIKNGQAIAAYLNVFAIPSEDVNSNPNLKDHQNPGY
jgi:hypothetical protein